MLPCQKKLLYTFSYRRQEKVINLPTLSHSDSNQDTDVEEVETASAPSESESF